jgi:putative membrane protein insertion efficiency factor
MKFLAKLPIYFYQKHLRHRHNRRCIYEPSCSHYGLQSIDKHGPVQGWVNALKRIKRCNGVLYKGGIDEP